MMYGPVEKCGGGDKVRYPELALSSKSTGASAKTDGEVNSWLKGKDKGEDPHRIIGHEPSISKMTI